MVFSRGGRRKSRKATILREVFNRDPSWVRNRKGAALNYDSISRMPTGRRKGFGGAIAAVTRVLACFRKRELVILDSHGERVFEHYGETSSGRAIQFIREMIHEALDRRVEEILLVPRPCGTLAVRFRAGDRLRVEREVDLVLGGDIIGMIKIAAGMDTTERRRRQSGVFSAESSRGPVWFRVTGIGMFGGEKLSIRVLAASEEPMSLREIGLTGAELEVVRGVLRSPSGLILVCGPSGSGKATTLYAMLRELERSSRRVISIEDPIERVMPGISQWEVDSRSGITGGKLLRNALGQNPGAVFLNAIHDAETAEAVVRAAQAGCLIVAVVPDVDGPGALDRLTGFGVPGGDLAAVLRLVVSQRLIRRLCGCRKRVELPGEYREYFRQAGLDSGGLCGSVGCRECGDTGYAGRRAVFDLLEPDEALRSVLAAGKSVEEAFGSEHGRATLVYEGFKLAAQGVTSIPEVERVTMKAR